ncbi:MAG: hypothetical protein U0228_22075 [Myxococcaceae bacterium]
MNERNTTETSTMERRTAKTPSSIWGEIVVEPTWRPQDKPKVEESWLRVNGYLPDRRQR